jgi:hypothetical protein
VAAAPWERATRVAGVSRIFGWIFWVDHVWWPTPLVAKEIDSKGVGRGCFERVRFHWVYGMRISKVRKLDWRDPHPRVFFAKSAQRAQNKGDARNCELRRVCKLLKRRDRVFAQRRESD